MDLNRERKPKSKTTQMVVPPRRGQIKMKILKSIAAALSCSGSRKEPRRYDEDAVPLSSTSTTPPIPSGYTSEA
ncbi:hypothetical protein RJT34_28517 [Clitoria ternatea]|uniref:Uncharacterized protein n=1 Tax=Clitoria ternatea TaxID=43366 RepID=A0AAN9FE58_CLITE